jgi:hypothetical protein
VILDQYLAALEARHLANLTRPELTRALRALSSCYVERRDKLAAGGALDGAGKRAAFALFYGPLHLLTIAAIAREIGVSASRPDTIHDLGCGTGVGGAAVALSCEHRPAIAGLDVNPWAVAEANWTYRTLGLQGRASVGDAVSRFPRSRGRAFLLFGYAVNEIPEPARALLLDRVAAAVGAGAALLVVEPIAKRDRGWWPGWADRLRPLGAEEREWRFPADLPDTLRAIAKSAGLDPRELTARTLTRL